MAQLAGSGGRGGGVISYASLWPNAYEKNINDSPRKSTLNMSFKKNLGVFFENM